MMLFTKNNFPHEKIIATVQELIVDESSIQSQLNENIANGTNNLTDDYSKPEIDSLLVANLLVKLEPMFGQKLPFELIRIGGYGCIEELKCGLLPKLQKLCEKISET